MQTIDLVVETNVSRSVRARQMESAFDVPAQQKCRLQWKGDFPYDAQPWNVGLIVGPSGCGKSSILRHVFGEAAPLTWGEPSVIDDFDKSLSIETITQACQAVGFNTIPAWLRPYAVLSNGERFRAEIARRMLETPTEQIIALDEFTSVVDRQVAQIASHAVQRFVRRDQRKLVAASCHYDIIDWLQPDWILEPGTMTFTRRSLRRRHELHVSVSRVDYSAWRLFAPFHYMSADLNRNARCFVMFVEDRPAVFCGTMHRVHSKVHDIMAVSRVVTLPDYQGLGLAFVLLDLLGSAYTAVGKRFHNYPAHPAFILAHDKSPMWHMKTAPNCVAPINRTSTIGKGGGGGRPCAVFNYVGPAMDQAEALKLLDMDAVPVSGAYAKRPPKAKQGTVAAQLAARRRERTISH